MSLSGVASGSTGDRMRELPFLPAENGCSSFLLRVTDCSGLDLGRGCPKTAKGGSVFPTLDPCTLKGISNDSHSAWSVVQSALGGLRSLLNLTVFVSFNWSRHTGDSVLTSKSSWYSLDMAGLSLISPLSNDPTLDGLV